MWHFAIPITLMNKIRKRQKEQEIALHLEMVRLHLRIECREVYVFSWFIRKRIWNDVVVHDAKWS